MVLRHQELMRDALPTARRNGSPRNRFNRFEPPQNYFFFELARPHQDAERQRALIV
ncbi:hypothetical protein PM082_016610 [Marasmius tenuissimus]|nr:hypothetical protein PM082_016610 [Marasmius tenuissimus]